MRHATSTMAESDFMNDQYIDELLSQFIENDEMSKGNTVQGVEEGENKEKVEQDLMAAIFSDDFNLACLADDNEPVEAVSQKEIVEKPVEFTTEILSDEGLRDYIKSKRNSNTTRKTDGVMRRFNEWLLEKHGEERDICEIEPILLNNHIGNFLLNLKKKDGGEMEPDTVTSYHRGIERHLRDSGYPHNIITSDTFQSSRAILLTKRKELKEKGLGNKPNRSEAITPEMEEIFWEKKQLGDDSARSVQNTVFYYFNSCFGMRASHEARQLEWGDISLKNNEKGVEYLEFCERATKTRTGSVASGARAFAPKIFANNSERCPVKFYKIFKSHRPEAMMKDDSPFYLSVKTSVKKNDKVWYSCMAMGKNTLQKIVSNMAKFCGMEGKFVNHSLRKRTCQTLLDEGVPDSVICQLTGHKNVNSLQSYATANVNQQKYMSDVLTGVKKAQKEVIPAIEAPQMSVVPAPERNPEVPKVQKMFHATGGMLAGATFNKEVNISIHYNMSSQVPQCSNMAVTMPIPTNPDENVD